MFTSLVRTSRTNSLFFFLEGLFLLLQIRNKCSQQLRGLAKDQLLSGWILQCAINVNKTDTKVRLVQPLLTLPISEVHDTTMVLGTVVDSRMREVIFIGRLGLFGSTPFFVGGRYPCSQKTNKYVTLLLSNLKWSTRNNLGELTGRLQGLLLTFTHRLGGKWSSWGQLVSDKQNLEASREMSPTVHWSAAPEACGEIHFVWSQTFLDKSKQCGLWVMFHIVIFSECPTGVFKTCITSLQNSRLRMQLLG